MANVILFKKREKVEAINEKVDVSQIATQIQKLTIDKTRLENRLADRIRALQKQFQNDKARIDNQIASLNAELLKSGAQVPTEQPNPQVKNNTTPVAENPNAGLNAVK